MKNMWKPSFECLREAKSCELCSGLFQLSELVLRIEALISNRLDLIIDSATAKHYSNKILTLFSSLDSLRWAEYSAVIN